MITTKQCEGIQKSITSIRAILEPNWEELDVNTQKLIQKVLRLEGAVIKEKKKAERVELTRTKRRG